MIPQVLSALKKDLFTQTRNPKEWFHSTYINLYRLPQQFILTLLPRAAWSAPQAAALPPQSFVNKSALPYAWRLVPNGIRLPPSLMAVQMQRFARNCL